MTIKKSYYSMIDAYLKASEIAKAVGGKVKSEVTINCNDFPKPAEAKQWNGQTTAFVVIDYNKQEIAIIAYIY